VRGCLARPPVAARLAERPAPSRASGRRRQVVAQAAEVRRLAGRDPGAELPQFLEHSVDLPLLAHDDLVQAVDQVLGERDLDLEVVQAPRDVIMRGRSHVGSRIVHSPAIVRQRLRRATPVNRVRPRRHHHHVYVVQLADAVWSEPAFRKANPDHRPGRPCVYVGMTGLDPDLRFDRHKAGIQANRFVQRYGLALLPELYEVYNPMPYEAAREMEVELAIGLREEGYAVWQA
jgi:hypothetical protein